MKKQVLIFTLFSISFINLKVEFQTKSGQNVFNNRLVFIGDNYIRSRTAIYASKMNDVTCQYNLLELNRQTYSYLGYESYGIRLESCFAPKLKTRL
jgi:hypothetical protein